MSQPSESASVSGTSTRTLERRPRLGPCLAAIKAPELYRNFAVHIFIMMPAAMVMCAIAARVDRILGLSPLISGWPARIVGIACIGIGGLWVWYVYGYLFLSGGGSPGTHVDGGPHTLVDTGPYTAIRHPSVLGKLLAVIGLGFAWESTTFLVVFVPLLLIYSLVTNRWLQERYCDARFGAAYQEYREVVPMLLPRPSGLLRWLRDESAIAEREIRPSGEVVPGMWKELRWYLVGLVGLIVFFGGLWVLLLIFGGA